MSTPYKILLVDDDKFLLDMYVMKFKQNGIEIKSAANGEGALKVLRDGFIPNILLLDLVMPGMDGLELLSNIRKEKLAPDAAAIILTNQNLAADIERSKKIGVDGYIVKASTIPSEVLEQVIRIYETLIKKSA